MGEVREPNPVGAIIDAVVALALAVLAGLVIWIFEILSKVRDFTDR